MRGDCLNQNEELIVRPFRHGDQAGIFALFSDGNSNASFVRTDEWWNWRHKDNPAGEAITWVAEADGKIVSHLSSVPLRAQIMGKESVVVRGGDGKTLPAYRKQGIFSQLMLKTLEEGRARGWALFLSLPSQQLHPTLIKLGWLDMERIPKFVKILHPGTVASVVRKERGFAAGIAAHALAYYCSMRERAHIGGRALTDIIVTEEERFGDAYDRFWGQISQKIPNGVIRDAQYLTWRYSENPLYRNGSNSSCKVFAVRKNKELAGFMVLGCYTEKYRIGRIMEFQVLPRHAYVAGMLLKKADHYFQEQHMDVIMAMAQNPFFDTRQMKQNGYFIDFTGKILLSIRPMAIDDTSPALVRQSDWLVSWGENGAL